MPASKTTNQTGNWSTGSIWTPAGAPADNAWVDILAGGNITLDADHTRSGHLDLHGALNTSVHTLAQSQVYCYAGGSLKAGDPTDTTTTSVPPGIDLPSAVNLAGSLGCRAGNWDYSLNGVLRFGAGASLILNSGATLYNFVPGYSGMETGLWQFDPATTIFWNQGVTVNYRQYFAVVPQIVSILSLNQWPDVSIAGTLGGIELITTDYQDQIRTPLVPPLAYVYRNGALWNGAIQVTAGTGNGAAGGQYFFDLSFADGVWQLGDHGQLKVFWCQLDASSNPQWFCRTYWWLVNRQSYETWQRVTKALPDAYPNATGGLPTDGTGDGQMTKVIQQALGVWVAPYPSSVFPDPADVRQGVNRGDGVTGSLVVPTAADVRHGVAVDSTSGQCYVPTPDAVLSGVEVDVSGTGTLGTAKLGTLLPVDPATGNLTILQGDDYTVADGRPIIFTDDGTWPDISTGVTSITLYVRVAGNNTTADLTKVGAYVAASSPQQIKFEPTHTDTTGMTTSVAQAFDHRYAIEVVKTTGTSVITINPLGKARVLPPRAKS